MKHGNTGKLIVGLFAIAAGTVFLLDQQGLIEARSLWRFWPLLFIAIGFGKLFERNNPDKIIGAGTMFLAGGVFLAVNFGYARWGQIWPVILIGFGLLLLWQAFWPRGERGPVTTGPLDSNAVFGSIQKRIDVQDFKECRVSSVFGSIELDMKRCEMAGDTAHLDVNVVFGNLELTVPDTWRVEVQAGAVFGNSENKTRPPLPTATPKTLFIRGDIVFGNIEVYN